MNEQKFPNGALVKIADKMPSYMSHFECGCLAIVEYTYGSKFGGNNLSEYCLTLENGGTSSWYEEDQLTLVKADGSKEKEEWVTRKSIKQQEGKDLGHVYDVFIDTGEINQYSYAYIWEEVFNFGSMWGANGEGINLYMNKLRIERLFNMAKGYGYDSDGFINMIGEIKSSIDNIRENI